MYKKTLLRYHSNTWLEWLRVTTFLSLEHDSSMTEWSSVFSPQEIESCQILNRFLAGREKKCLQDQVTGLSVEIGGSSTNLTYCPEIHFRIVLITKFTSRQKQQVFLLFRMIRLIPCLTQPLMRWILVVRAWSVSLTPIELRNEECIEPYLQLAVFFLNVVLKKHNFVFSACMWLNVSSYLQVLQLRFRIHLPPFLQLRHAIINACLLFETVTRDCFNGEVWEFFSFYEFYLRHVK